VRAAVVAALTLLLGGVVIGQSGGGPTPPADGPANAVRPGPPLETSGFRFQRQLVEGPPGLVTLSLDPAALAHSQGPLRRFADIRIVDQNGAQVPYLLESRQARLTLEIPVTKTVPRVPDLAARGGGAHSFYLINLPYEDLPQPALTLETSELIFLRSLELGVQRSPDRRHKAGWFESLVRTSWQHANPRSAPPPLEITFPSQRGRELLLIVAEGDNQPLPITGARLLLPGWQLRFFRPPGSLRLVYGRADLAEPQYDVARLTPSAMSGPAREIAAMPEITVATKTVWLSPRTFWVGLSTAVVVLLGLIVRLISSGTGQRSSPPGP